MAKIKFFDDNVIAKIQAESFDKFHDYINTGDYLIAKIKELIFSGQSPVSGFGRFQQYSKSYIDYIEGKARFFTKGGKVIRVENKATYQTKKTKSGSEYSPLSFSNLKEKSTGKNYRVINVGRGVSGKYNKPFPNKKKSPVNMYLKGDMMDSLKLKKDKSNQIIWVGFFKNKIAQYHDKLGAGKSKVIRRLLPTRQGEKFKPSINTALNKYRKQSVAEVLNDNRIALTIRFVFSTRR